jgi:RecG-like helicase
VVYPLVEESEKLEDVKAATQMAEEWRRLLPGVAVGLLHGA